MNLLKRTTALLGLLTMGFVGHVSAETAQEKGYQIVKAIDAMPVVEKSITENRFEIYDNQGKLVFTKKFRAANLVLNYKDPSNRLNRGISYFYAPADDKGNAALQIEKKGAEEDDQWIYLKGLRKPKRVLGSDKSSSFMGSDFSNGDLVRPDLDEATYTWLGTEVYSFRGKKLNLEKIEIQFKSEQMREDYGTSKIVALVHGKSGLNFKNDIYNMQGQLEKTMTMLSFKRVKNRDGKPVFMVTGLEMKSQLKGTKTLMKMGKITVGKRASKVKEGIFSLGKFTRRWW